MDPETGFVLGTNGAPINWANNVEITFVDPKPKVLQISKFLGKLEEIAPQWLCSAKDSLADCGI
ncbi:hypothetical protein ACQY0O_005520 [Thecaphora frezii]